jgi:hypothetical protein
MLDFMSRTMPRDARFEVESCTWFHIMFDLPSRTISSRADLESRTISSHADFMSRMI